MATIDSLISDASNRAALYASGVDNLVLELRSFIDGSDLTLAPVTDPDIDQFTVPPYVPPTQVATPYPVYEETTLPFPEPPSLVGVGTIDLIPEREEPTLDTTGLFDHVAPTANIPQFDETAPDLRVDEIVAELDAVVTPVIRNYDFPELHTPTLSATPVITLPEYDAPALPDDLRDPEDYAAAFEAAYARMAPEMQAFVDDKVSTWITTYAPEYTEWVGLLQAKIASGMDGGVLPDQFEAAMFNRAQSRVQKEYDSAIQGVYESFKRSGFIEPPGAMNAGLLNTRLRNSEALAIQSTEIYIERRKTEVQHAQFVMNLASSQISSVRNTAISYASSVGANMGLAVGFANNVADHTAKLFDHLIARSQLKISILAAVDAQYSSKLKAALAAYDGYRLELEAERARTDLDLAKISQVTAQINAEGLNIQKFSAIIDAVARKGQVEELKVKEYQVRSDIFGNKIKSQLASFDVFKAAMDGDKSKLDGELAKVKVFDSLINMDAQRLQAQVQQVAALQATNDAKVQVFRSGADIYKLGLDTALNKFTAQAEVKKLAQALYGQELTNAIEEFKTGIEIPRLMINAVLQQYQLRIQTAVEAAKVELEKLRISEAASLGAVDAYKGLASAALGSLNTVASSAISATA